MEKRYENLTNENLSKKFVSQFDLVNFAIYVAKDMIKSGRETRARKEVQNRAQQVLEEIADDKVLLDDIEADKEFERMHVKDEIFTELSDKIG